MRLAEWPIVDGAKALDELDAVVATAHRLGQPAIRLLIEARLARLTSGLASIRFESLDNDVPLIAEVREVVALAERTYPAGHPRVVQAKMALASVLEGISLKTAEAAAVLEAAWREANERKLMGAAHPVRLHVQSRYGRLLCTVGRSEDGYRLLQECAELARTHHGPDSRALTVVNKADFMTLLDSRMTLYRYELEYHQALTEYEKNMASLEAIVGRQLFQKGEQR